MAMEITMQRIRQLRRLRKLTQQELALRTEFSVNAIHSWERGVSSPSCEALAELAVVLQCSTDWLLGLTDIIEPTYSDAECKRDRQPG